MTVWRGCCEKYNRTAHHPVLSISIDTTVIFSFRKFNDASAKRYIMKFKVRQSLPPPSQLSPRLATFATFDNLIHLATLAFLATFATLASVMIAICFILVHIFWYLVWKAIWRRWQGIHHNSSEGTEFYVASNQENDRWAHKLYTRLWNLAHLKHSACINWQLW